MTRYGTLTENVRRRPISTVLAILLPLNTAILWPSYVKDDTYTLAYD